MRIFSYDEIDELGEGLIRQYLGTDAEQFDYDLWAIEENGQKRYALSR